VHPRQPSQGRFGCTEVTEKRRRASKTAFTRKIWMHQGDGKAKACIQDSLHREDLDASLFRRNKSVHPRQLPERHLDASLFRRSKSVHPRQPSQGSFGCISVPGMQKCASKTSSQGRFGCTTLPSCKSPMTYAVIIAEVIGLFDLACKND
jgi:hypothetical protein